MIGSRLHPEGLTVRERTSKKKLLYFDPWSGLGRRELLLFLRDWAFGKLGGASLNDEPIQPYYTTIDLNFIQSLPTIDIFAWMTKHSTPELDRSLLQSSTVTKGIVVQDGLHLLKTAREHRRTPLDGLCMLMHAFGPLFGAEMSEDPEHKLRITFLVIHARFLPWL